MPKCPVCGEDSMHLTDHECHTETERVSSTLNSLVRYDISYSDYADPMMIEDYEGDYVKLDDVKEMLANDLNEPRGNQA